MVVGVMPFLVLVAFAPMEMQVLGQGRSTLSSRLLTYPGFSLVLGW